MSLKKITFRILRFKSDYINPPQYQDFTLNVRSTMTVLDCLEIIRLEQDNTLMYRHSCHHASCGACVSACPATHKNEKFMGPAVLSAIHVELKKYPPKERLFKVG
jgi:succinate dehydrogenase/fumarate reductase-like Fe-S protein